MTLSHRGPAHLALARLAQGPATLSELRFSAHATGRDRQRLWHMATNLRRAGLIARDEMGYRLTEDGADALDRLRAGADVEIPDEEPRPTVRIFAVREAA